MEMANQVKAVPLSPPLCGWGTGGRGPGPTCIFLLGVPGIQGPGHFYLGHFSGLYLERATLRDETMSPQDKEQACFHLP